MKNMFGKTMMAVLAFSGVAMSQGLIEKTGPCGTLTRYTPPENWTTFPIEPPSSLYPTGTVQNPLNPFQSINCSQVAPELRAQIVASELTPGPAPAMAYLMNFTFDERGRIWAIDSRDYPYTHNETGTTFANPPTGLGRLTDGESRVVIMEDTTGDGAIDLFKVFYTGLVIPTGIEIVKNGVLVQVPPYIIYLPKSEANPDTSGPFQIVVNNMGSTAANFDSHGQPNSIVRGLDNFIYGHTGYNSCGSPTVGSNPGVSCGSGNIYRFKATAIGADTNLFEIHSTNGPANAHGIGQMEDGQWFKSGATVSSHSNHQVRHGTGAVGILPGGSNNNYYPATQDRYLWEGSTSATSGGFNVSRTSAVTGHAFYKARLLPQKYWNRFAFTCEGASGLCNQDSLVENGSTWRAVRMPGPMNSNIFASTDGWSAPMQVRTGPEGGLYVLDWYNYLFLHNPASPATNAAWRNVLRAKSRTRMYRILPADGSTHPVLDLSEATDRQLVNALFNTNFHWRITAQRLLVERGYNAQVGDLLDSILTLRRQVDEVGVDGPVLHAIWTLHGMKRFDLDSARWNPKLRQLLLHPAWTVRRNVALAMPATAASAQAIKDMCAVNDVHAHVRVQALQNLTRMPAAPTGPIESMEGLRGDTHLTGAFSAAGASKVVSVAGDARPTTCPAYLPEANWTSISRNDARFAPALAHARVNFRVSGKTFELSGKGLQSGELVVTDLRGRTVFRSAYNSQTDVWSNATARNMNQPFYYYAFRGVNGQNFGGRINMVQQTY